MTTVVDSKSGVKTDAATWTLDGRRIASAMWDETQQFSLTHWVAAVEASDLPHKVKATARQIAADAQGRRGYSTIDNQTLASRAGLTRDASITARLKHLRAAGFLVSKQRLNTSSVHRLTNPVGVDAHPADFGAKELTPLAPGEMF